MKPRQYKDYTLSLAYPKTEYLFLMGSKVKSLELKNLTCFTKKKKIVFDKYNIVLGGKKSGKTFLLYSLIFNAYFFNKTFLEEWPLNFTGFNDVYVKILFHSMTDWVYSLPKIKKYEDAHYEWKKKCKDKENNEMCFLFDQPALLYDDKERDGFLNFLKNTDAQMIITSDIKDDYEYPKEYNIIKI
jgi:hypothetical protein